MVQSALHLHHYYLYLMQFRISLHFPLTLPLMFPPISPFLLSPYPHVSFALLSHHPQPSLVLLTICGGHIHIMSLVCRKHIIVG